MNIRNCFFHVGLFWPFRRRVEFTFNLAALKVATSVCHKDLGEFFTSDKLTDEHRFFYQTYGAWLQDKPHTKGTLNIYAELYSRFNVSQVNKLKQTISATNIVSTKLLEAMKQKGSEKKNS